MYFAASLTLNRLQRHEIEQALFCEVTVPLAPRWNRARLRDFHRFWANDAGAGYDKHSAPLLLLFFGSCLQIHYDEVLDIEKVRQFRPSALSNQVMRPVIASPHLSPRCAVTTKTSTHSNENPNSLGSYESVHTGRWRRRRIQQPLASVRGKRLNRRAFV